jgi:iron complex outermembrane recepter protein
MWQVRTLKDPIATRYYKLPLRALVTLMGGTALVFPFALGVAAQTAQSQPPATAQPHGQTMPPVVVEAPTNAKTKAEKPAKKTKTSQKGQSSKRPKEAPAGPATAQTQPQPETATSPVKGIVAKVSGTATKNDTPLLETPQAVSVVTRAQMDQQGAQSLTQALAYTSGVDADNRTNYSGFDIVYVRGFNADRYLDGLKVQTSSASTVAQLETYGLERLEVLHGPASVLYGAGSPGGIVEAISKRPTDEPYHEVELTFGNFDHVEAGFDFSDKLTSDGKWSYRLTGVARDFDSQVDFNSQERYFIAPSLSYKPVSGTTITFLTSFQHDPETGLYAQLPLYAMPPGAPKLDRSTYLGEPGFNDNHRDQQSVGYALESKVDDTWTVRQNLRYMHLDGTLNQYQPLPSSFGGSVDPETFIMPRYALISNTDQNSFNVDTNAEAKFWTGPLAHKFLFGVDYQHYQERSYSANAVDLRGGSLADSNPINIYDPVYGNAVLGIPLIATDSNQVLNQTGIYAQDQIKFDRLLFTLGVRGDFTDTSTHYFADTLSPAGGGRADQSDQAFTQRYGVTYLLDGGLAPYFSYATSFAPLLGTNQTTGTPLAPTTGQQYEVGIKYQPTGYNALFTLAAYDLTQQNVLTTAPGNLQSQSGEVRSRGIEFEAKFNVTKNLDVIGSYTYDEAEITEDGNPDNIGKVPQSAPLQTAALWGYYTFHDGWTNGFGFGAGVRYVDRTAGDTENSFFVSAHTLFDLAAGYDFGKLSPRLQGMSVQLNVQNVGDLTYVAQCTDRMDCSYGNGRTILTTLRYQW